VAVNSQRFANAAVRRLTTVDYNLSVLRQFWKVLLAFAALTFVLTYPLSVDPGGRVLAIAPDTDLFIWSLAWDTHALFAQPLSLFDANIYYPESRTLAYSENLLGGILFSAPAWWLTGNAVLAMNVAALASCVLCGAGGWLLARRLGLSNHAALLAGIVFAFTPPRFLRLSQLHLTMIQWVPFTLAFLHSYLDSGRRRDLLLAALFFTLQALSSGHGAVFAALGAAALILYRIALGERLNAGRRLKDLGVSGAVLLLPSMLVALPYLAVQREMQLRRSLEDASAWAAPAASFLASPTHVHEFILSLLTDRPITREAWAYLFPGYLPLLLAIAALATTRTRDARPQWLYGSSWSRAALVLEAAALGSLAILLSVAAVGPIRWRVGAWTILSVRDPTRALILLVALVAARAALIRRVPIGLAARSGRWRERTREWRLARRHDARMFYVLLAILTVWLSASPPVGLWPAVYWLPGLNFIRVASRFTLLGVLCLAVLAAFGFDRLTAGLSPRRRRLAAAAACALLVAEFALIPLGTSAYRVQPPAADSWLVRQPKPFSVVEVPVPTAHEGGEERRQTTYMLHSMAHWQKTIHGYSGLRPPLHHELFRQLRLFPDELTVARLRALGVDYAVVHVDLYPPGEWPVVEERLRQFQDELRLVFSDDTARVYAID
jgi:hypothetical protein